MKAIRTQYLIAVLVLLALAVFSGGCLSGSSVPGPATAIVPAPVLGDLPSCQEATPVNSSSPAFSPVKAHAAAEPRRSPDATA
ncbi:hypothetical protein ABH15_02715 [Methanoculleus taiwanensis]|uniref:Uncharacterized protein n=1 Tax=Methanoculleus taiwanensis TaxID=1550565 RepID=A0A498H234_9EURY|nr:hypothetical protein [Methanoculleus taiwanensis]RXE57061.1 hypothetical protein ABH15_02715 [Methanoculleus taiwanensis]